MNIKNLSDKILLYFDQGIYFEDTPEGQVDYMMTNPQAPEVWQYASVEIYYNNDAELIYNSIEKL